MEQQIVDLINDSQEYWEYNNYNSGLQHTHWRVHYSDSNHSVEFEAICKNQFGSAYGIGIYGRIKLPVDMPVPQWNMNWTDIEA